MDIINLIDNQERFTLDNLLKYSPSEWLAEHNPVVVKFVKLIDFLESMILNLKIT